MRCEFVTTKVEISRDELLGKEFETSNCGKCFIIDYKGYHNVTVMFYEPFCIVRCHMSQLRSGALNNPMYPTYCGKGYIGVGKYNSKKDKLAYKAWTGVLTRTLNSNWKNVNPCYENVGVCEEWLCFQNFAEWCYHQKSFNFKDEKGKNYHLDKDILVKGNKTYSPETCVFVPIRVNNLFVKNNKKRGDLPVGVHYNSKVGKLIALISDENGKRKHLGCFNSPDEAFLAYKYAKEKRIKEVAEKWKDLIDCRAYEALMNYEVEITD